MGDVYLLVGPKGVGKTTVLSAVVDENPEYNRINYAEWLIDIATDEEILGEGELVLTPSERTYLRRRTSASIAKTAMANEAPTIVDGHFLLPTTHGFLPGFLIDDVLALDPAKIIILDASPETIQCRLEAGVNRRDLYASTAQIAHHRELVRLATMCAAMTVGARVYVVDNNSGVGAAATKLSNLLDYDVERMD